MTFQITVNSLYSGHCRVLELVSSLVRVCNSGSLFCQSVNYFCLGSSCCPYYRSVRYSRVFARRALTALPILKVFVPHIRLVDLSDSGEDLDAKVKDTRKVRGAGKR